MNISHTDWDEKLSAAAFAINTAKQTTGTIIGAIVPHELAFVMASNFEGV